MAPRAATETDEPETPAVAAGSARGAVEGVAVTAVEKADAIGVADGLAGGPIDWGGATESVAIAGGASAGVLEAIGMAIGVGVGAFGVLTGRGVGLTTGRGVVR